MNMINKLPIAAAVIGLALVFTQSAFKSITPNPNYYRDPQTHEWRPLGSLVPGTTPGKYSCEESDEQPLCTGYFDPNINPNPQPADQPEIADFGIFVLH